MATKQESAEKVLRLGVIQNGRVVEERLLRTSQAVTVGQKLSSTLVVPSAKVPEQFTVFEHKNGKYVLRFTEDMTGRVAIGSNAHDLASLRRSGKAKKVGDAWVVELNGRSRGKVTLGDATVLFQFVTAPPLKVLPQLPANMRGGPLLFFATVMGLSGGFLASLIFSFVSQVGAVLYLIYMVPPPQRVSGIDAMPNRFVQILAPEEPEETPDTEVELSDDGEPTDADEEADEAEPEEDEPQERAEAPEQTRTRDVVREQARERVRQESALAAFYGGGDDATGPELGFTSQLTDRRAEDVLSSQTALGEGGGSGGIVSRTGLGTSSGAEGAVGRAQVDGGGSRVAEEATTERTEERRTVEVRGNVRSRAPRTGGSGRLDDDSLRAVLRRRSGDIQRCYERALAQDPSLSGRILVQFTVGEGGRVTDARLRENELGSAVESCIVNRVRRWRFDEPEGGSVSAQVPYILEPGS